MRNNDEAWEAASYIKNMVVEDVGIEDGFTQLEHTSGMSSGKKEQFVRVTILIPFED